MQIGRCSLKLSNQSNQSVQLNELNGLNKLNQLNESKGLLQSPVRLSHAPFRGRRRPSRSDELTLAVGLQPTEIGMAGGARRGATLDAGGLEARTLRFGSDKPSKARQRFRIKGPWADAALSGVPVATRQPEASAFPWAKAARLLSIAAPRQDSRAPCWVFAHAFCFGLVAAGLLWAEPAAACLPD